MRKGSSGGGAAGKRKRGAALLAAAAAPFLLYLIVRSVAVALSPPLALALPPTDSSPLMRLLILTAADPRTRVPAQTAAIAREAAIDAPLGFEPFFVQARVDEQAGRLDSAIRLMEEARRRRPNNLLIHLQLAAYYQTAGRSEELLAALDFILRRSEEAKRAILPELARQLRTPPGRRTMAPILAGNPGWMRDFYAVARTQPIAADAARDYLERVRRLRRSGGDRLERGLYVQALVNDGDYRRAREMWLEMQRPEARQANALLFDPTFSGARAEPPFIWTFADADVGRASPARGYLDIAYFGGSSIALAEQIVALPPGGYRLAMRAKSESGITSGEIGWTIVCLPGEREIARLPLAGLNAEFRPLAATFSVPASGCSGQRLRLTANPGDIAATVEAQVAGLEIARAR